jgi:hypothetical protein
VQNQVWIELLAKRGADFGFETTLSGRTHRNLLRDLKQRGYLVHLFFLWLPTVQLAASLPYPDAHNLGWRQGWAHPHSFCDG